jgi:hypothetical protein
LLQDTESQFDDLVRQKGALTTGLTNKEGGLTKARSEVARYRRERDSADTPDERRRAEISYASTEATVAALTNEINQIQLRIGETDSLLTELHSRVDHVEQETDNLDDEQQKNDTGRDRRLRSWIDQIKDSKPKEPVKEKWKIAAPAHPGASGASIWDESWTYKDPEYDFFEQIHVVWDLVYGEPPRWLNAPKDIQDTLETDYGFASLDQGRIGWQWHLFLSVLACHLIAIFIPFLVLTIKLFLMPKALRTYYSSRHQAEAGDRDAWLARYVDESVKGS